MEYPRLTLDFETTGRDATTARPVSLSIYDNESGKPVLDTLIDCGVEIPADATAIHGISTNDVRRSGRLSNVVMGELVAILRKAHRDRSAIVIYNAPYDVTLVKAECRRQNISVGTWPLIYDPLVVDRQFAKYRTGKRRLTDLTQYYNVRAERSHTSKSDCLVAGTIAKRQIDVFEGLASMSPHEFHELQRQWFDSWKRDWNKWAERKAPDKTVKDIWPL